MYLVVLAPVRSVPILCRSTRKQCGCGEYVVPPRSNPPWRAHIPGGMDYMLRSCRPCGTGRGFRGRWSPSDPDEDGQTAGILGGSSPSCSAVALSERARSGASDASVAVNRAGQTTPSRYSSSARCTLYNRAICIMSPQCPVQPPKRQPAHLRVCIGPDVCSSVDVVHSWRSEASLGALTRMSGAALLPLATAESSALTGGVDSPEGSM